MRCLIIGACGMPGRQLVRSFSDRYETHGTVQSPQAIELPAGTVAPERLHEISLSSLDDAIADLQRLLEWLEPDFVVNAVDQTPESNLPTVQRLFEVNGDFPHLLNDLCRVIGTRLVHIGSDRVFDGCKGKYLETDAPSPVDDYGRSKLVGEITDLPGITLRASLVGLEFAGRRGRIEWAFSQSGVAKGDANVIGSGLTAAALARAIECVATDRVDLRGVWHVSSEPISEFDLLSHLTFKAGRTDLQWESRADVHCDRSLNSQAFQNATGYRPPSWDAMLEEMTRQIADREFARNGSVDRAA